jgi:SAM-dependent methyltransferase
LAAERSLFADVSDSHDVPPIADYWGDKFIRPMVSEFGFNLSEELFAKYLALASRRTGGLSLFLSLGAGNCDAEVRTAQLLREGGLTDFTIECLDMNPQMLERGRNMASEAGIQDHLTFAEGDFNLWSGGKTYAAIIADQSLHHVLKLEHLLGEVKRALHPAGFFVAHDMIGRNGHQRWPEALDELRRFWRELPIEYRWNRKLKRYEEDYINFDCSFEGFEGIRAQDVLPLLLRHFDFQLFVAFGNVIDVFVDRCFGFNFDADGEWDRGFIDRVHAFDEQAILKGTLTPTHMLAAMTPEPCAEHHFSRGLTPERCVRRESQTVPSGRLEVVTPVLLPRRPGVTSYSLNLAASGGVPPYTWLASDLPPGLTLNPEGELRGAIETDGVFTPLITVRDSSPVLQAVAQRYTILEKPRDAALPPMLLPSGKLHRGTAGVRYAEALLAGGGKPPLVWSLTAGALPPGLSLDASSGVISGEPLATSRSVFTVQVSDVTGEPAARRLELEIESPVSIASRVGVFPHLACGGGWSNSIVLVNPSPAQVSLTVEMRSSGGRRLDWPLHPTPADGQRRGSARYTLDPHASLRIAFAPNQAQEVSGWAEVLSTGPVMGHATLAYVSPGGIRSEVTIPLERTSQRERSAPFDNQGGNQTVLALLNLSTARPDALVAAFWDENGGLLSSPTIPLDGGRHSAFMLPERFPVIAQRRGIVAVRAVSGAPVYAVALRMNAAGLFTHLPQIP